MKHALRSLLKSPGFTAVAVLTLAPGIGANTAIFSVINGVLLRPLPYDQSEQLVNVWASSPTRNQAKSSLLNGDFFELRAQNQSFSALAGWDTQSFAFSGEGAAVTADLLAVFHLTPARGRFFSADEFTPGRDGVMVLSHAVWQQQFGADPAIVGRTLVLSGRPRTVVGILPEHFRHPTLLEVLIPYAADSQQQQNLSSFSSTEPQRIAAPP